MKYVYLNWTKNTQFSKAKKKKKKDKKPNEKWAKGSKGPLRRKLYRQPLAV